MIAFTIYWFSVYRYWLFYLTTFLVWYFFLYHIWVRWYFRDLQWLQMLLTEKLDDVFMIITLWVIAWWRLWHVFLYEWHYYSHHITEIPLINQWWMSFIWWFLWVSLLLLFFFRRWKISFLEVVVLWDLILCIVPLGILLWRIGNFLNQELRWKPISDFPTYLQQFFTYLHLKTVYSSVDEQVRVNVNIIQSFLEWFVLLTFSCLLFIKQRLINKRYPGSIVWVFMIWYALVRILAEELKDLPSYEKFWVFSISQIMMIFFIFFWILFIRYSHKNLINLKSK